MADQDEDAFYLVRKGDMIGIYKTLRDCQAQANSSVRFYGSFSVLDFFFFCVCVCQGFDLIKRSDMSLQVLDPSITVYKGYGMSKEAEAFLRSHGLKNPLYSINVEDAKDNLHGKFGALIPCPFQVFDLSSNLCNDESSKL